MTTTANQRRDSSVASADPDLDSDTKKGNFWSDLAEKCTYKIAGSAKSKDLYPLNKDATCPNPITMNLLSILLPIGILAAILSFVIPKYFLPYIKKEIIPKIKDRSARMAALREELYKGRTVVCSNCNTRTKKYKHCPVCDNQLPKPEIEKLKLIDMWRIRTLQGKITIIFVAAIIITFIVIMGILIDFVTGW